MGGGVRREAQYVKPVGMMSDPWKSRGPVLGVGTLETSGVLPVHEVESEAVGLD